MFFILKVLLLIPLQLKILEHLNMLDDYNFKFPSLPINAISNVDGILSGEQSS